MRAPMLALLADLEAEFGPGKMFRPYRDVRFSNDKTPYKTHCGATAGPYYVQLGPDGLMAAAATTRWRRTRSPGSAPPSTTTAAAPTW